MSLAPASSAPCRAACPCAAHVGPLELPVLEGRGLDRVETVEGEHVVPEELRVVADRHFHVDVVVGRNEPQRVGDPSARAPGAGNHAAQRPALATRSSLPESSRAWPRGSRWSPECRAQTPGCRGREPAPRPSSSQVAAGARCACPACPLRGVPGPPSPWPSPWPTPGRTRWITALTNAVMECGAVSGTICLGYGYQLCTNQRVGRPPALQVGVDHLERLAVEQLVGLLAAALRVHDQVDLESLGSAAVLVGRTRLSQSTLDWRSLRFTEKCSPMR